MRKKEDCPGMSLRGGVVMKVTHITDKWSSKTIVNVYNAQSHEEALDLNASPMVGMTMFTGDSA